MLGGLVTAGVLFGGSLHVNACLTARPLQLEQH
jgi:hypothetical protein